MKSFDTYLRQDRPLTPRHRRFDQNCALLTLSILAFLSGAVSLEAQTMLPDVNVSNSTAEILVDGPATLSGTMTISGGLENEAGGIDNLCTSEQRTLSQSPGSIMFTQEVGPGRHRLSFWTVGPFGMTGEFTNLVLTPNPGNANLPAGCVAVNPPPPQPDPNAALKSALETKITKTKKALKKAKKKKKKTLIKRLKKKLKKFKQTLAGL